MTPAPRITDAANVTRAQVDIGTPCYFCGHGRRRMCAPHETNVPTHFFVRCPSCQALWKIDVNASGRIVAAPDPIWYDSYSSLQTLGRKSAGELRTILRDATEGLYLGRERSAAAALRQASEVYLFAEVLGHNLDKHAPPEWGDAVRELEGKCHRTTSGRELLRDLKPLLAEVREVGLTGVHARPRRGVRPAGAGRIAGAFSIFDEMLKLQEKAHAAAS